MTTTVKCTRTVTYEISVSRQREDDASDGMRAGYYAWVGPPDDQSDFAVGPFTPRQAAIDGAIAALKRHGYRVAVVK